ncbi:ribulose-phosphate 3-epimerase [Lacticaseibacillus parahuelsenbergensis]|uniref:Ribulose-phosphate 3-epimerase n=1 Tax=Lacticaseibacillus parahuelsenbergensis TaxID=3068305 RepID=A0ABY9KZQ5_9LACO|nr:ribulose-phosphate 3-epimerase [Lacticaseibacillus sp. NCIMB 15471]WLV76802.1 ribulose-phosphate 3-epimerase [Lacticaseibacillus sp. NCIMB 15471]
MKIAPSILSADFAHLARDVEKVEGAGADLLHVDVMDGHFVGNLTFGPLVVQALRPVTNLPLEVHLMVSDPGVWAPQFAEAGADTILVHEEATSHLYGVLQHIRAAGVRAGVVVNPGTSLSSLDEVLPLVDQVLVMTVNPGFGGQKFLTPMVDKVARLHKIRQERDLHFDIEVDGGINDQTVKAAAAAGTDIFVAGSYVFGAPNVGDAITALREAVK